MNTSISTKPNAETCPAGQTPFAMIKDTLRHADVLFGNLETCFYEPAAGHAIEREGFYAPLASALRQLYLNVSGSHVSSYGSGFGDPQAVGLREFVPA